MIKLLIGGSPCTHWSIAQKNNRETTAEGIGWELFRNYLIAKEKFKPDIFLYENNKSAAQLIKDQISAELGAPLQYINSALVSAQNRQRFYCHNIPNVPQPEDRGILLRDVLESGAAYSEKGYCLTSTYYKGPLIENSLERKQRSMVAEPICLRYERTEEAKRVRKQYEAGEITHGFHELHELHPRTDGKTNTLSTVQKDNMICEPVRIGTIENGATNCDSQSNRVYSSDAKSVTLCAGQGGKGTQTGLYACPVDCEEANYEIIDGSQIYITDTKIRQGDEAGTKQGKYVYLDSAKTNSITAGQAHNEKVIVPLTTRTQNKLGREARIIYEVRDGQITIKGKQYPIKLLDGYYIIRKLTVTECCRLQTMPDDYCRAVSATQAYKGLGNGWTAEVIIHILKHANIPLDEEIAVLSMYDGIGTGRYCLDKMGYTNVTYHAYENDKYPMTIANSNYPDIIQHGDAFQVREEGWTYAD